MRTRLVILTGIVLVILALASCSDDTTTPPSNSAPVISGILSDPTTVAIGSTSSVTCSASDSNGDDLSYTWTSAAGTITGDNSIISWTAPNSIGNYSISCTVSDGVEEVSGNVEIPVFETLVPGAMVLVQGGDFSMGDSYGEGPQEETPVHTITVSSFMIGKFEVSQSEWAEHMPAPVYDFGSGSNVPVYYSSWFEIILYSNYKSMDEGLTPCYLIAGSTNPQDWPSVPVYSTDASFPVWNAVQCNWDANGYRLPTEAEWEYAARGGQHSADDFRFSGGQTVEDFAWFNDNAPTACQPIGTRLPNQLGIYDMSGNLYEFCWDWYGEDYYTTCSNLGTVADPTGVDAGDMQVVRGGSWGGGADNCRVAGRVRDYPVSGFSHTGFRLVKKP